MKASELSATSAVAAPGDKPIGKPKGSVVGETMGLASLSLLSPVAGLGVEMVLAWQFGTSFVVDAYRVAALLLIFAQQIFVTSILPYVVVPIFSEYRNQGRERDAWTALDSLANLFLLFGTLIAAAFFFFPQLATKLLAPGLAGEARTTAIFFIRWCGLAFIPLSWSGVACGILYAHGIFKVAPLAQLFTNVSLCLAIAIGAKTTGAYCVAAGVIIGAFGSAILYAVNLHRLRRNASIQRGNSGFDFPALKKLVRLAAPLLGGMIIGQASGAVVTRSLSFLTGGSLAAFGYSWKLGQMVLLTPGAMSTVLFPRLSEAWQSDTGNSFQQSYVRAIRATLFITLPTACLAYVLRLPIVTLILERGAFTLSSGTLTAALFGTLILGTPGMALSAYLDRMFYATQETKLPVAVDIGWAVLAMLSVPFVASRWGVTGVAIAYMLLPWLTCATLLALFQKKYGNFPLNQIGVFALRIVAASIGSAWLGHTYFQFLSSHAGSSLGALLISIGVSSAISGAAFVFVAKWLSVPESDEFLGYLKNFASKVFPFRHRDKAAI